MYIDRPFRGIPSQFLTKEINMKFSIQSADLQKVLSIISGVIPSKSTLPILENFLFEIGESLLTMTATDLDISMSISLKVKATESGKIVVPAKRLIETVRSLPNTEVIFSIDLGSNKITMTTQNGEYKLTGESSDNYPTLAKFKLTDEVAVGNEVFRRIVNKTSFAVSSDELRPAMMGVLFQIKKNEIRAAATDGHRLVRIINTVFSDSKFERDIVVPAKALNLAVRSFEGNECSISLSDSHIRFTLGDVTLMSRLIEEKYPNYESVIPVDNEKKLVVNKNELLSSVKRTALYASSTTHQVRFSLKKNSVTVSAEDIDFGSEANETLACDYTADPMEIGFNAAYILDVLSHIDTDEVMMMFSTPTRAGIVKPTTQQKDESVLMLVMPVRLNS